MFYSNITKNKTILFADISSVVLDTSNQILFKEYFKQRITFEAMES